MIIYIQVNLNFSKSKRFQTTFHTSAASCFCVSFDITL